MRSDQSRQALRDILENARLARAFVAGLDAASFAADRRTVYLIVVVPPPRATVPKVHAS